MTFTARPLAWPRPGDARAVYKPCVLVAEDARFVRTALKSAGYRTLGAADLVSAVALFERARNNATQTRLHGRPLRAGDFLHAARYNRPVSGSQEPAPVRDLVSDALNLRRDSTARLEQRSTVHDKSATFTHPATAPVSPLLRSNRTAWGHEVRLRAPRSTPTSSSQLSSRR